MQKETFKKEFSLISEMCNNLDVTKRTLIYYKIKELLFRKKVGKKRLFFKRDQDRLKLILKRKLFEFLTEEIKKLINLKKLKDAICVNRLNFQNVKKKNK